MSSSTRHDARALARHDASRILCVTPRVMTPRLASRGLKAKPRRLLRTGLRRGSRRCRQRRGLGVRTGLRCRTTRAPLPAATTPRSGVLVSQPARSVLDLGDAAIKPGCFLGARAFNAHRRQRIGNCGPRRRDAAPARSPADSQVAARGVFNGCFAGGGCENPVIEPGRSRPASAPLPTLRRT